MTRVQELRGTLRDMWPPVTDTGLEYIASSMNDLQQIHLFSILMLDLCGGSATVVLPNPSPEGPLEIA